MLSLVIHTSNYHYRKKLPKPAIAETEVKLSVLAIVFSKRISKKKPLKSNNILENNFFTQEGLKETIHSLKSLYWELEVIVFYYDIVALVNLKRYVIT